MKFFLPLIITIVFFIGSCKNNSNKTSNDSTFVENVDTTNLKENNSKIVDKNAEENISLGKEFTSKYICPMHCKGSGSDKFGTCPECGMEYIENPDYKESN